MSTLVHYTAPAPPQADASISSDSDDGWDSSDDENDASEAFAAPVAPAKPVDPVPDMNTLRTFSLQDRKKSKKWKIMENMFRDQMGQYHVKRDETGKAKPTIELPPSVGERYLYIFMGLCSSTKNIPVPEPFKKSNGLYHNGWGLWVDRKTYTQTHIEFKKKGVRKDWKTKNQNKNTGFVLGSDYAASVQGTPMFSIFTVPFKNDFMMEHMRKTPEFFCGSKRQPRLLKKMASKRPYSRQDELMTDEDIISAKSTLQKSQEQLTRLRIFTGEQDALFHELAEMLPNISNPTLKVAMQFALGPRQRSNVVLC